MSPPFRRPSPAFSLLEMLAVIAIIGILAALIGPAVGTILESSKLNTAVNLVADQIALARQTALAQSRRVEVRFYKFATPDAEPAAFRGIRARIISDTGESTPISPIQQLPQPIIISSEPSQNTVFRKTPVSYEGSENLPKVPNAPFFKFSFLPNGRTDFAAGDNPFLTIYSSRGASNASLPANYAVLQIDTMTGNVRIFRPNK